MHSDAGRSIMKTPSQGSVLSSRRSEMLKKTSVNSFTTSENLNNTRRVISDWQCRQINFFKNGIKHGPHFNIFVSRRLFPSLLVLLKYINTTRPTGLRGTCRYLFTFEGRKIYSLNDLMKVGKCVYSNEPIFKTLQYGYDQLYNLLRDEKKYAEDMVAFHATYKPHLVIVVEAEGTRPRHFISTVVSRKTAPTLSSFLRVVSDLIKSPVRNLYNFDGNKVRNLEDLYLMSPLFLAFSTKPSSDQSFMLTPREQIFLEHASNMNLDEYVLSPEQLTSRSADILRGYLARKYDIGKTIFRGNYTNVQICVDKRALQPYHLITIMKRSSTRNVPADSTKFDQIKILKTLKHQCLVNIIEVYHSSRNIFIITDATEGNLFDAIFEKTYYSEANISTYIFYISSALAYLHSLNIVHRNLRPENVLIYRRSDGQRLLKVGDMSLASKAMIMLFGVCGSPSYMAPEMIRGRGYRISVDLWALGILTYLLLSGVLPFNSANSSRDSLYDKIVHGRFEMESKHWDRISYSAKMLVAGLLTVDVTARMSAQEILDLEWIKDEKTANNINIREVVFPRLTQYVDLASNSSKTFGDNRPVFS